MSQHSGVGLNDLVDDHSALEGLSGGALERWSPGANAGSLRKRDHGPTTARFVYNAGMSTRPTPPSHLGPSLYLLLAIPVLWCMPSACGESAYLSQASPSDALQIDGPEGPHLTLAFNWPGQRGQHLCRLRVLSVATGKVVGNGTPYRVRCEALFNEEHAAPIPSRVRWVHTGTKGFMRPLRMFVAPLDLYTGRALPGTTESFRNHIKDGQWRWTRTSTDSLQIDLQDGTSRFLDPFDGTLHEAPRPSDIHQIVRVRPYRGATVEVPGVFRAARLRAPPSCSGIVHYHEVAFGEGPEGLARLADEGLRWKTSLDGTLQAVLEHEGRCVLAVGGQLRTLDLKTGQLDPVGQ